MTDDLLISGEMDINLCLSVAVLQQINMDHLQWSVAQYHGPLSTEFIQCSAGTTPLHSLSNSISGLLGSKFVISWIFNNRIVDKKGIRFCQMRISILSLTIIINHLEDEKSRKY